MKSFILNFRAFFNERKVLKRNEEIFLPVKDGVLTKRYRFVYTEKSIALGHPISYTGASNVCT